MEDSQNIETRKNQNRLSILGLYALIVPVLVWILWVVIASASSLFDWTKKSGRDI